MYSSFVVPFGSTVLSSMEEIRLNHFDCMSETASWLKAVWNCILQMLALKYTKFVSILRILFLSVLTNDQLKKSCVSESGSELSFSNVNILEARFQ